MKRIFYVVFFINSILNAQTKVFIPDASFRSFLNTEYREIMDTSGDSLFIDSAAAITDTIVDCSNQNIADLTGIQYFTTIKYLYCNDNKLKSLPDLSAITTLIELQCQFNELTSLPDLSNNTSLRILYCYYNQLTALPDLSANTALLDLSCSFNQINSLPSLASNTQLYRLIIRNNNLTSLPDLSSNTALSIFHCSHNQLDSLQDLSANTALTILSCTFNNLIQLPDLSSNIALEHLSCYQNNLTSLPDLSDNVSLVSLHCGYNSLAYLPDLSSNIYLTSLYFAYNNITCLPDLSANSNLETVECYDNKLDFSDAKALRAIDTLPNLSTFKYAPQNAFGKGDSINLIEGDTLIVSIASQDSALSYQWFRNDIAIADAIDTLLIIPDVNLNDNGIYKCRAYGTALNKPPMISDPGISEFESEPYVVNIDINTGIMSPDFTNDIKIYPNPNTGIFTIVTDIAQSENLSLRIYNCIGQLLYIEEINQISGIYSRQVDLQDYSTGIYYLQVSIGKEVIYRQILVE